MDNGKMLLSESRNVFEMRKVMWLIICIAVPLGVGFLSAFITKNNMMVFDTIRKPFLTPPAIVFPIAWTILYILMGLASFNALIECDDAYQAVSIMYPYLISLVLNFAWSIIFFNYQRYGLAFICLLLLWLAIMRTMVVFGSVSHACYYLLTPYLLWVTFAGYLNLSIVMLNPR